MEGVWDKARRLATDQIRSGDVDLSTIEELRIVERGSDRQLIDVNPSENLLSINLDALGEEDRQGMLDGIVAAFESQQRLFAGEPNKVRSATKKALTSSDVREAINQFSQFLDSGYLMLVEESLVLNQGQLVERLPNDKGDDLKEDIASTFEDDVTGGSFDQAITAIHLASSGHLTSDGTVVSIFEQLNDETVDYHRIFSTILKENPFLLMVGRRNRRDQDELVEAFKNKMRQADQYQFKVPFIEGRAAGGRNRQALEEVILTVQRDALTLNYDCAVRTGETVYQLFPGSWQGDRN
ncbi:hypothetical protein [Halobacterium noricense]|uniref:hypothetical protein n=1 Tax=Halobacterium noricense TaxID=223182 RepID=UPI001E4667C2|nr:hypothetical protein [Halobacterium noricense]UHH26129.1 hypothetical protein LT974_04150 [Halobacterium noricense]